LALTNVNPCARDRRNLQIIRSIYHALQFELMANVCVFSSHCVVNDIDTNGFREPTTTVPVPIFLCACHNSALTAAHKRRHGALVKISDYEPTK
jgi:hypothetical protein